MGRQHTNMCVNWQSNLKINTISVLFLKTKIKLSLSLLPLFHLCTTFIPQWLNWNFSRTARRGCPLLTLTAQHLTVCCYQASHLAAAANVCQVTPIYMGSYATLKALQTPSTWVNMLPRATAFWTIKRLKAPAIQDQNQNKTCNNGTLDTAKTLTIQQFDIPQHSGVHMWCLGLCFFRNGEKCLDTTG